MTRYNCGSLFGYCKGLFIVVFLCTALSGAAGICMAACEASDKQPCVKGRESAIAGPKKDSGQNIAIEGKFEQFDDFIVRLRYDTQTACRDAKDADTNGRVLLCTIVVQMNEGTELPKDKLQLRKIIYGVLREPFSSSNIRETMRKKIKSKLNAFIDKKGVDGVYFAKFILL
jgi:hypothetical protein